MNGVPLQFVALFCFMFIALIAFNSLIARRRQQREGIQEQRYPWYQHTRILTLVEYVLLAMIFLLNVAISYHSIPASIYPFVLPLFIFLIFASGLLAGYIIFLLFRRSSLSRRSQAASISQAQQAQNEHVKSELSPEARVAYDQRRRSRRQKAALARRRKAGKA